SVDSSEGVRSPGVAGGGRLRALHPSEAPVQFCRYEQDGHVVRITITRPEVMNALHPPASVELAECWDRFAGDDEAWVAVLTGEGDRAFSAGNDLKYTAEMSRLPAEQ